MGKAICIGFTVTYTNAGSGTSNVTTWIRILLILRTLPLALAHENAHEREREKHTFKQSSLFELFSTRGHGIADTKISILFPRFFPSRSRLSSIRNEIFARRHARVAADFYLVSYFYLLVLLSNFLGFSSAFRENSIDIRNEKKIDLFHTEERVRCDFIIYSLQLRRIFFGSLSFFSFRFARPFSRVFFAVKSGAFPGQLIEAGTIGKLGQTSLTRTLRDKYNTLNREL